MMALAVALAAGAGAYLIYTAFAFNRTGFGSRPLTARPDLVAEWLLQAGLAGASIGQLCALVGAFFVAGTGLAWIVFGGFVAPLLAGIFAASFPVASLRARRQRRLADAAEAWPRMIEEIRLRCGSLGRPIPQALIEVGKSGPVELRPAFLEAEREWLMSTDFVRTVALLKKRLADPTADATCETLLVAHSIGGSDVDKRLSALADDRRCDLNGRKDAKAKQAGVRFARRFVLIVPVGMALAGMSIGSGRDAYSSSQGQLGVTLALIVLAGCWWWAGRLIKLPTEDRVLRGKGDLDG